VARVVLVHESIGFGDLLAVEPIIRGYRNQGDQVRLCTTVRQFDVTPLAEFLGAPVIEKPEAGDKVVNLLRDGRSCPSAENPDVAGNRTRGYAIDAGKPEFAELPRLDKKRLPPPDPRVAERMARSVFVQIGASERYRSPTSLFFEQLWSLARRRGIPLFPEFDLHADILTAIATVQLARAVIAYESSWLHFAGALGMRGVVIVGPGCGKNLLEYYPNLKMLTAPCPFAPCWRTSANECRLGGDRHLPSHCITAITPENVLDSLGTL